MSGDSQILNSIRQHPQQNPLNAWVLVAIFALYILLRILAWANTFLLEDHDSILYIKQIQAFLTFDPDVIIGLSPDSTPFYPFIGALLSLPGWSAETGARLCSLLFSVLLFVASAGILRKIASPLATAIGLTILAISPFMISFSISVLSEPTYVAVTYLGLWYFLAKHKSDSLGHAAGLGIVFGLTFLNRLEGMLFLALIPAFQCIYNIVNRETAAQAMKRTLRWSAVFVVAYMLVAGPQVLIVSEKMDRFSLNGRQVWAQLLLSPEARSYDEEIYGLDYSPSEINLTYLQKHNIESKHPGSVSVLYYAESLIRNLDKFYATQIGKLGGPLLIAFFLFGILGICKKRLFFEAGIILMFVGAVWSPGLLAAPIPRSMAVAVPALAILAGPGITFVAREFSLLFHTKWPHRAIVIGLMSALIAVWIVPFLGMYLQEKRENLEYSLFDLEPVQTIVRQEPVARARENTVVTSRKQYLAYFSGVNFVPLPFTDFNGLILYCKLNSVDFLFLQHRLVSEYPFMDQFLDETQFAELERIYRAVDSSGEPIELYRFN